MAEPIDTVQELVSHEPPELQRHPQCSGIHGEPLEEEVCERRYQEGQNEHCYVDNEQPLDDRRKLRKDHSHLRSMSEICLSVISIVNAHNSKSEKLKVKSQKFLLIFQESAYAIVIYRYYLTAIKYIISSILLNVQLKKWDE
jgi:hypothetical protein